MRHVVSEGRVAHVLTVDVEEYFQVEGYSRFIRPMEWAMYPGRVEKQTNRLLELLDPFHATGTFFLLGWVAKRYPDLVRKIASAGHEIASHGLQHTMITKISPEEFREDLRCSKALLEDITGRKVLGYRAPTFSITRETAWAHDIIREEGYAYSSSVFPIWHDRYGWPQFGDEPMKMDTGEGDALWEIPLSVWRIGPFRVPFGGGGYLRFYPLFITKALFRRHEKRGKSVILYIHPWELDSNQPRIEAPFGARTRHSFGIGSMEQKMKNLLQEMEFLSIEQFLDGRA
jgi:polysaccharide deacetylase family protein (PEP-CTERM system associated)